MEHRLQEIHRDFTNLKRLDTKKRKRFLKTCSKDCLIRICECIKNVLNANLPINPAHLKKLSRHKQTLRILATKKTSLARRRHLLQKGGFIGAIASVLIPAISSLITGLANR